MKKQALLERNQKLIDMVITRAKRDFPEDIALIGLTGSFSTGDYHEKSDLDLIIINNTARGWEISACFLLGDIGYDIYCTPWETRISEAALLESPIVSHLMDLQVLYYASPADLMRFQEYQAKAERLLALPIGPECLGRAEKALAQAKQAFGELMLTEKLGPARAFAGTMLNALMFALYQANNQYIRFGVKRYLEQMLALEHVPEDWEWLYLAVIEAKTLDELRFAAREALQAAVALHGRMRKQFLDQPSPSRENTRGLYEELWCNNRNKVYAAAESGNSVYAFQAALGAQDYINEMAELFGMPAHDLMAAFDAKNYAPFLEAFEDALASYRDIYHRVGRDVAQYESFDALQGDFLAGKVGR